MIRLLNKTDQSKLLEYLYQEPSYNIFQIGDIETFGFKENFLRIYGEFDDKKNIISTFLRYRQSGIYYAKQNVFNHDYLEVFRKDPFNVISGKDSLMDLIEPHLNNFKKHSTFFCSANQIKDKIKMISHPIHVLKTKEDCEKLYYFMSTINEFKHHIGRKDDYVEGKLKSIQMGTTLFIEVNNQIVSTVATTAETKMNAMVVSVATAPYYRHKGLATSLLQKLMDVYINKKNKSLCLFYDNPNAGKIYLSLGFKTIGKWSMYFYQKDHDES